MTAGQAWARTAPSPAPAQSPPAAIGRRAAGRAPHHEGPPDGPERIYVITGGRSGTAGLCDLDLVTLIVAIVAESSGLSPEEAQILRLCRWPLSVAEISAYLRLPFSATAVLVSDLLAAGLVSQRRPVRAAVPDPELLREVIRGLQRL